MSAKYFLGLICHERYNQTPRTPEISLESSMFKIQLQSLIWVAGNQTQKIFWRHLYTYFNYHFHVLICKLKILLKILTEYVCHKLMKCVSFNWCRDINGYFLLNPIKPLSEPYESEAFSCKFKNLENFERNPIMPLFRKIG